ncbi:VanZ family protein [uncultured Parolsenella sp.]|uniref:VanZ family protein n=1 Tax=uncultured Parolsenella sp. TaxID=2083008 RepID=UPI0025952DE3|nr:VanZ family protein [uncultured Parolsenella sp.]
MGEDKPSHSTGPRIAAWVRWLAVAAWACFVWSRSLCDGPESSAQSNVVTELLRPAFAALGVHEFSACTFIVRKAAHFLEYLVLGVLLALTREEGTGPLWPRALLGVLVPSADETIQLFVPGRSGQIADIALDCCGVACGMALVAAIRGTRSARPRCRT